jgi:hypothetical protein
MNKLFICFLITIGFVSCSNESENRTVTSTAKLNKDTINENKFVPNILFEKDNKQANICNINIQLANGENERIEYFEYSDLVSREDLVCKNISELDEFSFTDSLPTPKEFGTLVKQYSVLDSYIEVPNPFHYESSFLRYLLYKNSNGISIVREHWIYDGFNGECDSKAKEVFRVDEQKKKDIEVEHQNLSSNVVDSKSEIKVYANKYDYEKYKSGKERILTGFIINNSNGEIKGCYFNYNGTPLKGDKLMQIAILRSNFIQPLSDLKLVGNEVSFSHVQSLFGEGEECKPTTDYISGELGDIFKAKINRKNKCKENLQTESEFVLVDLPNFNYDRIKDLKEYTTVSESLNKNNIANSNENAKKTGRTLGEIRGLIINGSKSNMIDILGKPDESYSASDFLLKYLNWKPVSVYTAEFNLYRKVFIYNSIEGLNDQLTVIYNSYGEKVIAVKVLSNIKSYQDLSP